jgi:hypothetical protein
MLVHNIGQGPKMEDVLFNWKITGHYPILWTKLNRHSKRRLYDELGGYAVAGALAVQRDPAAQYENENERQGCSCGDPSVVPANSI